MLLKIKIRLRHDRIYSDKTLIFLDVDTLLKIRVLSKESEKIFVLAIDDHLSVILTSISRAVRGYLIGISQ